MYRTYISSQLPGDAGALWKLLLQGPLSERPRGAQLSHGGASPAQQAAVAKIKVTRKYWITYCCRVRNLTKHDCSPWKSTYVQGQAGQHRYRSRLTAAARGVQSAEIPVREGKGLYGVSFLQ